MTKTTWTQTANGWVGTCGRQTGAVSNRRVAAAGGQVRVDWASVEDAKAWVAERLEAANARSERKAARKAAAKARNSQ